MIWILLAALARTAEKTHARMRLLRTITLPARKTLMALPYGPPPDQNAVVAGAPHAVAADPQSARIKRDHGRVRRADHGVAAHLAFDRVERNAETRRPAP